MTKKARTILSVSLGVLLLVGIAILVTFIFLSNRESNTANNPSKPTSKSELKDGRKAELDGDAEKALNHYKKAKELCANSDEQCLKDTEVKIMIMNTAIKDQEALKAKYDQEAPQLPQDRL